MSFGTFFWPTEPEKTWAFLDVLMEMNIPFVSIPQLNIYVMKLHMVITIIYIYVYIDLQPLVAFRQCT